MPRTPDPGKIATYNYAKVEFSPFAVAPSAPKTLTSDPWSYLTAWINQQTVNTRGANRKRLERALYYANLAESFHKSAEEVALPTRGTLAYYGILNLVKCFLSVRGVELETQYEHHGLSLVQGSKRQIQIGGRSTTSINIFAELAAQLGTPVSSRSTISLEHLCAHLPEIHEIAFTLNHLPGNRRRLLPITIQVLSDQSDTWLFSSVRYELKQRTRVQTNRFLGGARQSYFRPAVEEDGFVCHRSQRRKRYTVQNLPSIYRNICNEYGKFNIASLLTADGYRYYCDLANPDLHHLCYSVALMFYIGTAARYRPTEMVENLNSDLRPLLAEAVTLTPPQILYHLVSLITSSNCCVPRASVAR